MHTVRKAIPSDLDQLSVLFNSYRVFYEKEPDLKGAGDFLKSRMDNGDSQLFVCEAEGNKLIGFTQLYPLFSSTRMKKLWLLNDLFVDSDHRGKGASIALIEEAKELCRKTGACGMYLETAKSNAIGNELYPRAGFVLNKDHNFYDWETE